MLGLLNLADSSLVDCEPNPGFYPVPDAAALRSLQTFVTVSGSFWPNYSSGHGRNNRLIDRPAIASPSPPPVPSIFQRRRVSTLSFQDFSSLQVLLSSLVCMSFVCALIVVLHPDITSCVPDCWLIDLAGPLPALCFPILYTNDYPSVHSRSSLIAHYRVPILCLSPAARTPSR